MQQSTENVRRAGIAHALRSAVEARSSEDAARLDAARARVHMDAPGRAAVWDTLRWYRLRTPVLAGLAAVAVASAAFLLADLGGPSLPGSTHGGITAALVVQRAVAALSATPASGTVEVIESVAYTWTRSSAESTRTVESWRAWDGSLARVVERSRVAALPGSDPSAVPAPLSTDTTMTFSDGRAVTVTSEESTVSVAYSAQDRADEDTGPIVWIQSLHYYLFSGKCEECHSTHYATVAGNPPPKEFTNKDIVDLALKKRVFRLVGTRTIDGEETYQLASRVETLATDDPGTSSTTRLRTDQLVSVRSSDYRVLDQQSRSWTKESGGDWILDSVWTYRVSSLRSIPASDVPDATFTQDVPSEPDLVSATLPPDAIGAVVPYGVYWLGAKIDGREDRNLLPVAPEALALAYGTIEIGPNDVGTWLAGFEFPRNTAAKATYVALEDVDGTIESGNTFATVVSYPFLTDAQLLTLCGASPARIVHMRTSGRDVRLVEVKQLGSGTYGTTWRLWQAFVRMPDADVTIADTELQLPELEKVMSRLLRVP